ncbi:hypothetical protein CDEST_06607 [Colletotrichum destructivum]|uniref:Secreted protein n=1 Tax=Colletotrichum destructivum TaxID=34406 RepID=A0AAX4IFM3_9PEZI|nr:hypothetical protein CDEST_06607 [Colletotrichum destructivum]
MLAAQQISFSAIFVTFFFSSSDRPIHTLPRKALVDTMTKPWSFCPQTWIVVDHLACGKWEDASHLETLTSPPAMVRDAAPTSLPDYKVLTVCFCAQTAGQTTYVRLRLALPF